MRNERRGTYQRIIGRRSRVLLDVLVRLLQQEFDVVGVARDGRTMIEMAKSKKPGVTRRQYNCVRHYANGIAHIGPSV